MSDETFTAVTIAILVAFLLAIIYIAPEEGWIDPCIESPSSYECYQQDDDYDNPSGY